MLKIMFFCTFWLRISVFYNRKFKKIREIAGFIPNPLRFHGKTESEGRKFVKTGTGKNRGFREHFAIVWGIFSIVKGALNQICCNIFRIFRIFFKLSKTYIPLKEAVKTWEKLKNFEIGRLIFSKTISISKYLLKYHKVVLHTL